MMQRQPIIYTSTLKEMIKMAADNRK